MRRGRTGQKGGGGRGQKEEEELTCRRFLGPAWFLVSELIWWNLCVCVLFACHICVFMCDIIGMSLLSHVSKTSHTSPGFWCPNWFDTYIYIYIYPYLLFVGVRIGLKNPVCVFVRVFWVCAWEKASERARESERERARGCMCACVRGGACVFVCAYMGI